jgi:hypothetical protein
VAIEWPLTEDLGAVFYTEYLVLLTLLLIFGSIILLPTPSTIDIEFPEPLLGCWD